MKKIGLTGIYFPGALEALHENVPEGFELVEGIEPEDFPKLAECDYLITRLKVDESLLHTTPKLKLIQRWGAGYNDMDLEAWGKRDIPISTCPGVNSGIAAELTIMLMLAVYRNLLPINRKILNNVWPKTEYFGRSYMINGKTVGIIGLGNIGSKVAKLVTAFCATVQYYDIERKTELEAEYGYKFVSQDELLRTSDIVTLHTPLTALTRGMIDAQALAKMKPLAILINAARGPIVDEDALVDALEHHRLLGAGLDTYAQEPLPADNKLVRLDNVVASAHAGGNTKDNDINMVNYCYSNILNFENHRPFNSKRDVVNKQYLKTPVLD